MDGRLLIRFTKMTAPYSAGEVAGKTRELALRLARSGAAVLLDPPPGIDKHGKPVRASDQLVAGFTLDEFDLSASREPKHVGGGVFEVAGVRVKGKAKAEEIVAAIAELPTPVEGD